MTACTQPAPPTPLCPFCISVTARTETADWQVLLRATSAGSGTSQTSQIVADYFGVDKWKVEETRRRHVSLDAAIRCLSRRTGISSWRLSQSWISKPAVSAPPAE